MKAKLIVEGKEFDIDIFDPKFEKLVAPKKTGYERVENRECYYVVGTTNTPACEESHALFDNEMYEFANYYSDQTVAENNARADKLMRQLRRFAVEHREHELRWKIQGQNKYRIYYNYSSDELDIDYDIWCRDISSTYFDTEETANLAIETFHDELIWYFTEYKDSL